MAKSLCITLGCRHLDPFLWVCSLHLFSRETTPPPLLSAPGVLGGLSPPPTSRGGHASWTEPIGGLA